MQIRKVASKIKWVDRNPGIGKQKNLLKDEKDKKKNKARSEKPRHHKARNAVPGSADPSHYTKGSHAIRNPTNLICHHFTLFFISLINSTAFPCINVYSNKYYGNTELLHNRSQGLSSKEYVIVKVSNFSLFNVPRQNMLNCGLLRISV